MGAILNLGQGKIPVKFLCVHRPCRTVLDPRTFELPLQNMKHQLRNFKNKLSANSPHEVEVNIFTAVGYSSGLLEFSAVKPTERLSY